ncbi:hypothetical protein ABZZ79_33675 [Streptomyces sp. NPDC006458]|uniref:hypothetical protein n=1 Tax=Streptomyces sp. NPDC006458 TaxID=3154302 RepID=UPI0033B8C9AF
MGAHNAKGDRPVTAEDADRGAPGAGRDLLMLLAGAATAAVCAGGLLALSGSDSPLRGPFTLFFLLGAPASAFALVLRGPDPLGRAIAALGGAIVVDMLVAQGMLALGLWSVRGGIVVVAAVSALTLLLVPLRRLRARAARRQRG